MARKPGRGGSKKARNVPVPPGAARAFQEAVRHHQAGRASQAEALYRQVVEAHPDHVDAWFSYGVLALQGGRSELAASLFAGAVQRRPGHADAHNYLSMALRRLGRVEEAARAAEAALQARPRFAEAHANLAAALQDAGRTEQAIGHYRKAVALKPDLAEAHNNLATACREAGLLEDAVGACRRVIALRPDLAAAHANLGNALYEAGHAGQAAEAYGEAVRLNPDDTGSLVNLAHLRQHVCDWDGLDGLWARVLERTGREGGRVPPFPLLASPATAGQQLACARAYGEALYGPLRRSGTPFRHEKRSGGRITVGYLSADFHKHATAYLTAELFERHDRERFRVIGYSYGPDDGSPMRARLKRAFESFVDLRGVPHMEAARRIHADGVDILVDLKGYTRGARPEIPALRPAPVQVNWLGYPGTMGVAFMDYLVGDPFCTPPEHQPFYSERLALLPDCYQVNDRLRPIAETTPTRAACGLPVEGFVFCCFNASYKITPEAFGIWMRLLTAVPGSVLWLLESNPAVPGHLRAEAQARGVDPARLVFAPGAPNPEYLARYRIADLVLDTWPYNAHTTAADALWAGCPLVTFAGDTLPARVAGSILRAAGLPELVTDSAAAYEEKALRLARHPEELAALRARLAGGREGLPLFDSPRFTRHLERAYETMWTRHLEGRPPEPFAVPPEGGAGA